MAKEIKTAIIGLGLLGTSLAMALKKVPGYRVLAWARREEPRKWVREHGAAHDVFDDLSEILKQADIAVLCTPVSAAIELLKSCAADLPENAVLTDIGSVKRQITEAAAKYPDLRFIGSHPMAGTEYSGCESAIAELYNNADIFITPGENTDAEDVKKLSDMWLAAGAARIESINPEHHDELVADTSHVLHLLASAMTLSILDAGDSAERRRHFAGCATGFRDTTRIASSNPVMWRGIMEENCGAVLAAVERFEKRFQEMKECLCNGDFDRFEKLFSRGKMLRGAWLGYKRSDNIRFVLCGIKHCGKTTVGKILAELLAAEFIDTDELLAKRFNCENGSRFTVREIYRELGEERFRRMENDILVETVSRSGASVIALGGGALTNPFVNSDTREKFGEIIWLDLPDNVAWERIKSEGIPPFLAGFTDPEAEFRKQNSRRRQDFEAAAAHRIEIAVEDIPEDIALRILGVLK